MRSITGAYGRTCMAYNAYVVEPNISDAPSIQVLVMGKMQSLIDDENIFGPWREVQSTITLVLSRTNNIYWSVGAMVVKNHPLVRVLCNFVSVSKFECMYTCT
jgi:hypothetical protein